MTRAFASLAFFLLGLSTTPGLADVLALPRWVFPEKKHDWSVLSPSERTRPVIVGDILYAARMSGEVYAIHRTDGFVLWRVKMPAGVDGSLTYGRSLLVVGDIQGNLWALNARDGSKAWEFKAPAEWLSPATVMRGRVLAMASSEDLYALGETDGKEKWHYSHRGDEKMTVRGTATPVVFGNEIFQGFSDGYLVALSAPQGKEIWKRKLGTRSRFYDVDFTPHVDESHVTVATYDGSMYNLDRLTGNTNWIFPVGSYSGCLVEDGVVYYPGLDHNFYALDSSHGQLSWKVPFEGGVGMQPTKVGEYFLMTTTGDPMYLIDPKQRKTVWSGPLGAGSFAAASGDPDGWFYTLSNYGNLYSYQVGNFLAPSRTPRTLHPMSALFHAQGPFHRDHL